MSMALMGIIFFFLKKPILFNSDNEFTQQE